MSLYKELEPYLDYLHSLRRLKNYLSFDMRFPQKWVMLKNLIESGQVVPFEISEENYKGFSFVSLMEEDKVQSTIDTISRIIRVNKEKEMKEKLFKQYVDKLKMTFESNDIEKLQNLYFEFEQNEIEISEENNYEQESESTELVGEPKKER